MISTVIDWCRYLSMHPCDALESVPSAIGYIGASWPWLKVELDVQSGPLLLPENKGVPFDGPTAQVHYLSKMNELRQKSSEGNEHFSGNTTTTESQQCLALSDFGIPKIGSAERDMLKVVRSETCQERTRKSSAS